MQITYRKKWRTFEHTKEPSMKKIIGISLLSAICTTCFAHGSNDCGDFHIQISNISKNTCILTSQRVIHGTLITPPPTSIMPNDSKRFDMQQTFYGPSITLNYQCGDEIISFTSQQNYCYIEAGDIAGTITHPAPKNLNANFTALSGSFWWSKSGSINWQIVDIS